MSVASSFSVAALVAASLGGWIAGHAGGPAIALESRMLDTTQPASDTIRTPRPAPAASKQRGPCLLDFRGGPESRPTRASSNALPSGNSNIFVGGYVEAFCRGEDVTIFADSAEYYGDEERLYLIGHVRYRENRVKVDADRATYWTNQGHLFAEGNVYGVTESGNTMRGPVADYYRAMTGVREQPEIVATGRPILSLVQRDSAGTATQDTVYVVAERLRSVNDSLVYGAGKVEITRPDIVATGDSVFLDNGIGYARLMRTPRVDGRQKGRPFTLTGDVIDVFSTQRQVDRIVATPSGHIVSDDLQLFADSIDMRVANNQLVRAMAWGAASRARAISPDQEMTADSIDTRLHNQQVHEIRAIGKAYATGKPDTATIISTERDWLEGDSILAQFDTSANARANQPAGDTSAAKGPPLKSLLAITKARAYYHLQNQDGVKNRPGVNYVTGRVIDIAFANRVVQTVTVTDQASGVYLEPMEEPAAPPAAPATAPSPVPAPAPPQRPVGEANP